MGIGIDIQCDCCGGYITDGDDVYCGECRGEDENVITSHEAKIAELQGEVDDLLLQLEQMKE